MNKYVKKCLIVYSSLTLILVGMAGAAFAVTATDADRYITRSQFAVDMSTLQTKLEEKESSILGTLNRYRTTDIKFVTFDTPEKYHNTSSESWGGYHTGGNMWPRKVIGSGSGATTSWLGWANVAAGTRARSDGMYSYLSIYRLWNGNYYVTNDVGQRNSMDTSVTANIWDTFVHCAVPIENYPGWYFIMASKYKNAQYMQWYAAAARLDPNTPSPTNAEVTAMQAGELVMRFKKDLWTYIADNPATTFTVTPKTFSYSSLYQNNISILYDYYYDGWSHTAGPNCVQKYWLDPDTGDFMISVSNFPSIIHPSTGFKMEYLQRAVAAPFGQLIPKDNVEYLMGPRGIVGQQGSSSSYTDSVPDLRYIGMGLASTNDPYWEYEFVDCINGIKYWHAVKKGTTVKKGVSNPDRLTFHYSLPIVY